ncbi:site-specific integrase [Streptomyces sp. NPDC008001]|uniref:site-specific integrase n=1 Tax=Streptomyces sp. NPDC008001 TaxID=3364804 RepID=UPI0036EC9823
MALARRDAKSMRAYAYTVLMLLGFLLARGADLRSATERDILQFRQWRREDAEETVEGPTWDRDAAAIVSLYKHLVRIGYVRASPWRSSQGESLGSGFSTDVRVRHLELEQYLFFRDVGFGGLTPEAKLDETFGGWRPHRNRAAVELALLTGMRAQEWSTLLLPELGLMAGDRPRTTDVDLAACAKQKRPRSVYVPVGAMELLDPYTGQPQHTDGKLTKNNLCREAGVSRVTMNRAPEILLDWDSRVATSPAGIQQRQRDTEVVELQRKLRKSREECHSLQEQVDAAATVIMTLLAENVSLREHAIGQPAAVIPFPSARRKDLEVE